MENHIFADGIGRISVMGGIVRLDLMTYSATEKDLGGQPRAVLNQRIVMGAESFLRVSEQIQEAAQQISRAAKPQPQPVVKAEPAPPQPQPRVEQPRVEPARAEKAAPPPPNPMPSPWSVPLMPKRPFP